MGDAQPPGWGLTLPLRAGWTALGPSLGSLTIYSHPLGYPPETGSRKRHQPLGRPWAFPEGEPRVLPAGKMRSAGRSWALPLRAGRKGQAPSRTALSPLLGEYSSLGGLVEGCPPSPKGEGDSPFRGAILTPLTGPYGSCKLPFLPYSQLGYERKRKA